MLLMVKKVSDAEYVRLFIDMWKLVTNIRKVMIKINNFIP